MSKDLAEISFADLLPSSIAGDERFQAAAKMLDGEIAQINRDTGNILIWSRIDELEEPLLSTLAWELHVDYWDDAWPLDIKRGAVKNAYILHMYKGTPAAVEDAVTIVLGDARVEEWFEYGGQPGHFKVFTSATLLSEAMVKSTINQIKAYKNTRSWLDALGIQREINSGLNFGFHFRHGKKTKIGPRFVMSNTAGQIHVGLSLRGGKKSRIGIYTPGWSAEPVAIFFGAAVRTAKTTTIGVYNG